MNKKDYFFYELLILAKNLNEEKFKQITSFELIKLKAEYKEFEKGLNELKE